VAKLPAYAIAGGRGQINSTGATPTGKDINSALWTCHQRYTALTMNFSGLFPHVVLLALGILAPWGVEGEKSGEWELLWSSTVWVPDCFGCVSFYRLFLSLLWT